jgi:predicted nucleotidyltransferase
MKDTNLDLIKSIVRSCGDYEVYLFGSRARGDNRPGSDYDIIVVSKDDMDYKTKLNIRSKINKMIANNLHVPSDVLMQSENELARKKELIGNVIRYASKEWVKL